LDLPETEDEDETFKEETERDSVNRHLVVLLCVEGIMERIARVMRKHQVPVAMSPVKTLKSLLMHPEDELEKEEIKDCVYKIPCASCEKCYIGETGRKFGTRLKDWLATTILDRESDKSTRWIKEAVHIRKEG